MSKIPRSTALALAALLGACGGGGGGPTVVVPSGVRTVPASANADASSANYATLAPPFIRAVLGGSANGLISPLQTGGRSGALAAGASPAVFAPSLPGRTMLAWLRHLPDPARKGALAVSTDVLPCTLGGSITVRYDDADNSNSASPGDSLQFTAADCVDDVGLPAANGGFAMTINAVDLDGDEPVALDVTGAFQNFSLQGYGTLNGPFRLWARFESAASTRLRVSYQGATLVDPSGTVVYDFDIDGLASAFSGSYELSGGIGIGGATFAVSTESRVQLAPGQFPASGQASLRDAAGDSVRVVPRSATTFDLAFYPAGATTPSATLTGLLWADYVDGGD